MAFTVMMSVCKLFTTTVCKAIYPCYKHTVLTERFSGPFSALTWSCVETCSDFEKAPVIRLALISSAVHNQYAGVEMQNSKYKTVTIIWVNDKIAHAIPHSLQSQRELWFVDIPKHNQTGLEFVWAMCFFHSHLILVNWQYNGSLLHNRGGGNVNWWTGFVHKLYWATKEHWARQSSDMESYHIYIYIYIYERFLSLFILKESSQMRQFIISIAQDHMRTHMRSEQMCHFMVYAL